MFNLFRSREKSVRYMLGAILVVISLSMLLYLIPGGPGGASAANENVVATVGSAKITVNDVQQTIDRMMGNQPGVPRALLATYAPAVVNQMVEMYAKAYKAKQLGLSVSDDELATYIQRMVSQQAGGRFDKATYAALVEQRGYTVPQFEDFLRVSLLASRYDTLAANSLVVTDDEARREYQHVNEKVALQYVQFSQKDFTKKVNMNQAAVKAWYEKNRSQFQIPEKRSFDLIVGSDADFAQSVNVSDADLHKQYNDNIDSYRTPERVDVRHILIKTTDVPKDEVPKLKAKAEDVLKQLKGGADFATLAKKYSQDPGSAAKGGDLGWIVRGQTVPAFEKAAFSLKPNQLSDLITTEYGFHVIQVLAHQEAQTQSFDEVKPQLLAEARRQIGDDNMQKAVSDARDEIARNPSQAENIAKKYGLKFFKADQVASGAVLPDVNSQPELSNAVFASAKGEVTPVIPLDNVGKAAFASVTTIFPPRQANFDEVQKDVIDRYTTEQATELMQAAAKQAAEKAKNGQSLEAVAKEFGGEVKSAQPFTIMGAAEGIGPAKTLEAAFAAKTKVGDAFGPVTQANSAFVCKVTQKTPADMSKFAESREDMIQTVKQRKAQVQQGLFADSVVAELEKQGVIKLNTPAINRLVASYKS
jgi:Parvulin-like peptidyl-prolyl isomerase